VNAPSKLRLAFYGDDFTGSTDALEVLAFAGIRAALFLEPPSPAALASLGDLEAVGVAGDSRAMTPQEMDAQLPAVFEALAALGAPIVHYKVCSTFDSGPAIGSIGRVMEIARRRFPSNFLPIVAATPRLSRWCAFGHLFARSGTDAQVYRLDRHPIMSVHPVTPMDESDLTRHLARQGGVPIGNLPFDRYEAGDAEVDAHLHALAARGVQAVLLDAVSDAHMTRIGRLLHEQAQHRPPLFVVGSSGAEYALTQWWRQTGGDRVVPDYARYAPVDRVLAISGSASALSARQIAAAIEGGFTELPVDAAALVNYDGDNAATALAQQVIDLLRSGRSVILHTARGPDDPRIGAMLRSLQARGASAHQARHEGGRLLGLRLGAIARAVLDVVPLRRLLLSGGDTSSQVTKVLAPQALVIAARLAPGAPLCRFVGGAGGLDGLEVALKGGQMGGVDFFVHALGGRR